jgi:hypothetical protein
LLSSAILLSAFFWWDGVVGIRDAIRASWRRPEEADGNRARPVNEKATFFRIGACCDQGTKAIAAGGAAVVGARGCSQQLLSVIV